MKFSSVLGTFALSTLEAYHAYASPLEAVSPVARTLAANSYCCVRVAGGNTYGFPYNSETASEAFSTDNNCMITVTKGKAPSQDGCKSWPVTASCPQGVKAPGITLFAGPPC
ncbi:hypothetical protein E4U17_005554 [Claviceps sp. LM77 group G4]|nr:hypothetical protein E4U17_005551 [Claviceps sp. LM77 group G4]KAG6052672.1 hypothetical protein E4U17_005554 [Claviceps sp. LM77 group G4]KAG6054668.1 hypothetical protein E4U33_008059 [Claviceps sp. LM78 group G4]KAG6069469.1 hypothetical protein E4U16_007669 [Claviceps sp. LM84 group G4]